MIRHAAGLFFFAAVLAIGLTVHGDFGVPWDEPIQRSYGRTVANYVVKGQDGLFSDPNRVYGSAYELALLAFERVRQARDGPEIFAARHLFNFVTFWVALIFFYLLALRGSRGEAGLAPAIGLLVCVALVLSPTLFGHAFFNSKDLPFLSAFVIAAWSLMRVLERPTVPRTLVHAVMSGWLIALRIPGILILALTAAAVVYCLLREPDKSGRARRLALLGVYMIAAPVCVWIFWPTLWRNPVASFWHALQTMTRYPWDQRVLYRGALVPATDLPWHYAPVWIAVTTPLVYLAAFVAGVPATVKQWLSERTSAAPSAGALQIVVLGWFLTPLVSVVVLGSVLYDAWRQLFFVYPALLLIAMHGVVWVTRAVRERWQTRPLRWAAIAAAVLALANLAGVLRFMIQSHPHSHVYFNALAGGVPGARFRYELDYWGLAYRAGLEAMLRHDRGALVPYLAADPPGGWNAQALPFGERQRLMVVKSIDHAKYFLGAYRLEQSEYAYSDVIHQVKVSGVPILTVALIRPELSMTTLGAPEVVEVLERNASRKSLSGAISRAEIESGLRTWLEHFVRRARRLDIGIIGADEQVRRGQLEHLTVRIEDAELGDFRSGKPGIPAKVLELAVRNAVIDLPQLAGGELHLVHADEGRIAALELDAESINRSLQARTDDLRRLRVAFENGLIRADWQESTPMQAQIRLWSGPDPWKPDSENVMFEVDELRVSGWRVPGAGLLPWLGGLSSPLISPDRVRARMRIGPVRIEGGKLRVGG